jgi:hypothetical protein
MARKPPQVAQPIIVDYFTSIAWVYPAVAKAMAGRPHCRSGKNRSLGSENINFNINIL